MAISESPKTTDRIALCLSLILCLLSIAFRFTPGLLSEIADDGVRIYSKDHLSTGSDDDLCVHAGAWIFGSLSILFGLWRISGYYVALKAAVFFLAWSCQVLLLLWIEVGSIFLTIKEDTNVALLTFLAVLSVAPLLVTGGLVMDFRYLYRFDKHDQTYK